MIFLFIILPVLLFASLASLLVRILFGGFGFRHRYRRGSWINGAGYGPGYGPSFSRHRHGLGGSLLSVLVFVALDRLFTRRY